MKSLVEVPMEKIRQADDRLKELQAKGKTVYNRLKAERIKIRTWIFFRKEISKWEYCCNEMSWFGPGYWARRLEYITEFEETCLHFRNREITFTKFHIHGEKVLLSTDDYETLRLILESQP